MGRPPKKRDDQPEIDPSEYAHLLSPVSLAVHLTRGHAEPYQPARHLKLLNEELVALHDRRPGYPRRLMVTMPPRAGKSLLISHWFCVWNLALDPRAKIIMASYGLSLAQRFGRQVRNTVQEFNPVIGTNVSEDSSAGYRWETTEGGGMESRGLEGGITGLGFNVGIIDDPIKDAADAQSKTIRDAAWDWYTQTFLTRRNKSNAIIVLVMTRWNSDDLAGRILDTEPEHWRVVNLPALAEENDILGRQPGESIWPENEIFSVKELEAYRTKHPRPFNALYQQRPAPAEGAAIQRSWWRLYKQRQRVEDFDRVIQTWDPTFKAVASSDYVAGWILGLKGKDVYVLDGIKEHLDTPQTMRAIKNWRVKWPQAKLILIEESASGPAIMQMLSREFGGIVPIKTKGKSKEQRLHWQTNSVAGYIEAGHLFLPTYDDSPENKRVNDPGVCRLAEELIEEASVFPFGDHDDQLDALTQGCQFLMPAVWSAERKEQLEAEDAEKPVSFIEYEAKKLRDLIAKRVKAHLKRKGDKAESYPGWTE